MTQASHDEKIRKRAAFDEGPSERDRSDLDVTDAGTSKGEAPGGRRLLEKVILHRKLFWILAAVIVILDLWTKDLAISHVEAEVGFIGSETGSGGPIWVAGRWLGLVSVTNKGGPWGMGSEFSQVLLYVRIIALFVILYILSDTPKTHRIQVAALALVMGGAIGNIYDSLNYGHVRDFIFVDLDVPPADPWPAFNLADSAICTGVFLLAVSLLAAGLSRQKKHGKETREGTNLISLWLISLRLISLWLISLWTIGNRGAFQGKDKDPRVTTLITKLGPLTLEEPRDDGIGDLRHGTRNGTLLRSRSPGRRGPKDHHPPSPHRESPAETGRKRLGAAQLDRPAQRGGACFREEPASPRIAGKAECLVVNFAGEREDEFAETAAVLDGCEGIDALEMNLSCPNVACARLPFSSDPTVVERLVKASRKVTDLPLFVKLSPNVGDIVTIAKAAMEAARTA